MPVITSQPQSLSVSAKEVVPSFSAGATGTSAAFAYQWQFNGTNITLATGTSYTVSNAQPTNQGNYSVKVSNPGRRGGQLKRMS